jgi:hypothetical protein
LSEEDSMKKVCITGVIVLLLLAVLQIAGAQTVVRLGDLPKADYSINVYQVFGFHEGYEGYKLTYFDMNNEPQHLYLPIELRDRYRIYRPKSASGDQNFIIIWKKGETLERIEWFMPRYINYDLPNFVIKPFGQEDKAVFDRIVGTGELMLGIEVGATEPEIRVPGGGE